MGALQSARFRPFRRARQRLPRGELPACQAEDDFRRKHAGSLEALRVTRPEAVDLVGIKLEEHLYIHDQPPEPRIRIGRSDLSVARPEIGQSEKAGIFTGVLGAPARVETPEQDVERVPFLEIRDRLGRELITVVELIEPIEQAAWGRP